MSKLDIVTFAAGMLGFGLLAGGIAMFSVPAALIVAGITLMAWSYIAARAGSKG